MEVSKRREIQTAEASKDEWRTHHKPFGPEWGSAYWGKWQTISYALYELGLTHGATILDVGMGTGWTTVFLAESGFAPTGVDIAPASVEVGRRRARRYSAQADFVTADMDVLDLDHTFDAVLVFDALHHSTRQAQVVAGVARHVAPGGWILFGEPSWLHTLSPEHVRPAAASDGSSAVSASASSSATARRRDSEASAASTKVPRHTPAESPASLSSR